MCPFNNTNMAERLENISKRTTEQLQKLMNEPTKTQQNSINNFNGNRCIFGIPKGIEPNKPYKVVFNATNSMEISDEHSYFTLISPDGYTWETSLKRPLENKDINTLTNLQKKYVVLPSQEKE